jgi:hypothetical protein
MSHHASDLDPEMRRQIEKMRGRYKLDPEDGKVCREIEDGPPLDLGPTGKFPRGKLTSHDEGEIKIAVAADKKNQAVIISFQSQVTWIGFDYDQAMALSDSLRDKANELRGIVP